MMRAKLHKNHAAIADYTAVIDMAGVRADILAMALYNRALIYHATGCESDAIDDLNKVLEMANVAENVKTEAQRKLVRMERGAKRTDFRDTSAESHPQGGTHARSESKAAGKHTD
jgi:hypothetical protein